MKSALGSDVETVEKTLVEKLNIALPDDFLKRWLMAVNEKPLTKEQLDQAYRDIHWNVLTHPDTFEKITKSVDNPEVGAKIEEREKQLNKYNID